MTFALRQPISYAARIVNSGKTPALSVTDEAILHANVGVIKDINAWIAHPTIKWKTLHPGTLFPGQGIDFASSAEEKGVVGPREQPDVITVKWCSTLSAKSIMWTCSVSPIRLYSVGCLFPRTTLSTPAKAATTQTNKTTVLLRKHTSSYPLGAYPKGYEPRGWHRAFLIILPTYCTASR
jgi:hypothetical protein